jgi:sarcosine oxidase subunit beta
LAGYDVIIIGAGSVGVPTAMALGEKGYKVVVIDKNPDVGQGMNSKAIGGIRATHSIEAKVITCLESIKIFSSWKDKFGDDIGWVKGGYCFPVYSNRDEEILKKNLLMQKRLKLNISWLESEAFSNLIPGIEKKQLLGGTYSPEDGRCLPQLSIKAFYKYALSRDVEFKFKENVIKINNSKNRVDSVKTNKGNYKSDWVINATGPFASKIGDLINIDLPVYSDPHEAGKTHTINKLFNPLVVDLRSTVKSRIFYLYQNRDNEIIFTITPYNKQKISYSTMEKFEERISMLLPFIKQIKIKTMWKGVYPMTPDGIPIIGEIEKLKGLINAIGMGGQGVMLGPGIGELIFRIISNKLSETDKKTLKTYSLYRNFMENEYLK